MKKRILMIAAIVSLLLNLCACRAASVPDTTPGTTEATAAPTAASEFVEVWREGERSLIPVQTVSGQAGSYTVATDPEYFVFIPQEGSDLFSYETWVGAQPVYYRITPYIRPYDPQAFATQPAPASYAQTGSQSLTVGGYPATLVTMSGFGDAAGYCIHRYLVDCGNVRYCIEAQFTQEMYEGLYAIMCACFDTFRVTE